MTALRVVVVDDEPLAREGLVELLRTFSDVEVVGAWADAREAITAVEALRPDALFLDVQMPGLSGFDLVDALELEPLPSLVFVTAHESYAVRAFEVTALDYLLKPVTVERVAATIGRLTTRQRERGAMPDVREAVRTFRAAVPGGLPGVGRLIVREVGQVHVVPTREVDWIEGADYYARLHVGTRVHLIRETLTSLEQRLDARRFLRIHRSAIVNLSRVRRVEAHQRGDAMAILASGARLKVMRSARAELESRLEALHESG